MNLSLGMKHDGVRNQNEFSFDEEGNLEELFRQLELQGDG